MALKAVFSALTAPTGVLALAAVLGLSSCGSTADDPLLGAARDLASGLLNTTASAPAPVVIDPRQVLTRALINTAATPLILVESEALGAGSTMIRIASNGPDETWEGAGDATVTLSRDGVLRATRGLIHDLYAADIEATRRALRTRTAGRVQRGYVHLGGDLQQIQTGFACEISFAPPVQITIFDQARPLTPVLERCSRPPTGEGTTGAQFENRYWIDSSGFAWASEQWAGPELGHFRIERLYR